MPAIVLVLRTMDFQFEQLSKQLRQPLFSVKRPVVIAASCLLVGLSGCDRFGERTRDVINSISIQNLTTGEKLIKNEVSNVELTLPEGWEDVRKRLRPDADLYAAHEDRSMYVLVLADQKRTVDRGDITGFDLSDNSNTYRSYLDWGLTQEQTEVATDITKLNGLNARQYEVRGRIDDLPVIYLHTTIEGAEHYYQVVAWSSAENYANAKAELQNVINSFRGT
ncbi:MAG: hypothetical protein AAF821_07115 [Cyanobacteria bacterium P01_D01_bin.156]